MKRRKFWSKVIYYVLLCFVGFIMLYPLYLIVNISLKSYVEYLQNPIGFVQKPQFGNYIQVWDSMQVISRTFTTLWITGLSVLLNMVLSILAAYPLSRNLFKGSGKVYLFILASMFFPSSLIAIIITLKDILHVYGTPLALILIWSGGLQMNIFMLCNFLKTLPRDLDEAAFIDGCGYFRYVFTIAMPLMLPIVVTLVMLKVIGCWNDFLNPYIYVTDPAYRTLSTGLYLFMGQYASQWQLYTAAVFIVAAPMVILYLFCQKFIIAGMISGAVKG